MLKFPQFYDRIPIWPYAKLIVTCWLVIPYFSGAAYVYEHVVRPFFVDPHKINIWYVPRKKDVFKKPDDILTAAEKYIEEHGTEAFEKIIHKVCLSTSLLNNPENVVTHVVERYVGKLLASLPAG